MAEEAYFDTEEEVYFDAEEDHYHDCRQFKCKLAAETSEEAKDRDNKPYFKHLPFQFPTSYMLLSCVMLSMYWVGMMLYELGIKLEKGTHVKLRKVPELVGFLWLKQYVWPPPLFREIQAWN